MLLLPLQFPGFLEILALLAHHRGGYAPHLRSAHFKIGERAVTQALLEHDHYLIGAGHAVLESKGFSGADFEPITIMDPGAHMFRPDRKDEKPHFGYFGGIRRWTESASETLKG